jgi:uracil DNA glycosylase
VKNKYVVKILVPNRDKLVELLDALPTIDVEVSVVGQEPIVRASLLRSGPRAMGLATALRSRSMRRSCSGSTTVRQASAN